MNPVLIDPPLVADIASLPEVICALKRVAPLNGLTDEEYEWLARNGNQRHAAAGLVLFHDGDPATHMSILLKGEIHVRRQRGPMDSLFIGRSGQITGVLPFSRMKTYGGTGFTSADTWVLEYERSTFPEMLEAIPSMAQRCVGILLDRVREITRMEQQTEKLTALGKLAANLAHELNNPASAAQRAAGGLLDELRVYGHEKYKLGALCMEDDKLKKVREWQDSIGVVARERQATGGFGYRPAGRPHLRLARRPRSGERMEDRARAGGDRHVRRSPRAARRIARSKGNHRGALAVCLVSARGADDRGDD